MADDDQQKPPLRCLIELTVKMVYEYGTDDGHDDEQLRFFLEENHCIHNIIDQLHREVESQDNQCVMCGRSEVKFIRRATDDDVTVFGPFYGPLKDQSK